MKCKKHSKKKYKTYIFTSPTHLLIQLNYLPQYQHSHLPFLSIVSTQFSCQDFFQTVCLTLYLPPLSTYENQFLGNRALLQAPSHSRVFFYLQQLLLNLRHYTLHESLLQIAPALLSCIDVYRLIVRSEEHTSELQSR